jgi:hypothetical protein|tara:strand:- start:4513 stop:4836 length:324 start_codon:yes stop_codon:yes gene_type:complete
MKPMIKDGVAVCSSRQCERWERVRGGFCEADHGGDGGYDTCGPWYKAENERLRVERNALKAAMGAVIVQFAYGCASPFGDTMHEPDEGCAYCDMLRVYQCVVDGKET